MKPGDVVTYTRKDSEFPEYVDKALGVIESISMEYGRELARVQWITAHPLLMQAKTLFDLSVLKKIGELPDEPTQTFRHAEPDTTERTEG